MTRTFGALTLSVPSKRGDEFAREALTELEAIDATGDGGEEGVLLLEAEGQPAVVVAEVLRAEGRVEPAVEESGVGVSIEDIGTNSLPSAFVEETGRIRGMVL